MINNKTLSSQNRIILITFKGMGCCHRHFSYFRGIIHLSQINYELQLVDWFISCSE